MIYEVSQGLLVSNNRRVFASSFFNYNLHESWTQFLYIIVFTFEAAQVGPVHHMIYRKWGTGTLLLLHVAGNENVLVKLVIQSKVQIAKCDFQSSRSNSSFLDSMV